MSLPLPKEFLERMKALLGEEYPDFLDSFDKPKSGGLRVNPQKTAPQDFASHSPFSLAPIPWAEEGFSYTEGDRPGRHAWYEAGVYYIQEPSAMAVGALADPKPGERVLDLCAAPGGKTTHLAGRMNGEGILVANEIHPTRANILAQSVERMGISNAVVLNETPHRLAEHFAGYFDCIVVDAPCSGEGMFRKDDIAISEWKPESPQMCADRQDEILDEAVKMLRPNGRLVYSTCTFAPVEDEGSVSRLIERHPEIEIVPVEAPWFASGHPEWVEDGHPDTVHTFRLFPHKLNGEGHYAAVLRKKGGEDGDVRTAVPMKEKDIPKEWIQFVEETLDRVPEGMLTRIKDTLWLLPTDCPELSGLHVKRAGIELGTLKKNRFEPSHALSHALNTDDFQRVANAKWSDEVTDKYLRGDTFPTELGKGWCAVAADGFVLGWGKSAGGIMKNHYPKGLRWVGR